MHKKPALPQSASKSYSPTSPRGAFSPRHSILSIIAYAMSLAVSSAQDDSTEEFDLFDPDTLVLGTVVVTANKYEQPRSATGSSVTVLDGDALATQQIRSLENSFKLVPGAITASSGPRGSVTSLFLRGTESDHTQIVIDGVRISDANIFSAPFLGGENLHNLGSVEILRGPQSSLYGGESIGGVVSLFTRRGEGHPTVTHFGEAGSFGTFLGGIAAQGEIEDFAYSFSSGTETTQNDRQNNDFEQFQNSLRIDIQATEDTAVGFTLRHAYREYGSPNNILFNDPDNTDIDSSFLLTSFIESAVNDIWSTKLTLGAFFQELTFETPPTASRIDSTKLSADWQNVFRFSDQHTTLLGAGIDETSYLNTDFISVNETEQTISLYAQHSLQLTDDFILTGGVRREEYESFGEAWTHRATASWQIPGSETRIHGSYGTGFRAPSFFDLFGMFPGFVGNPNLNPEKSRGWDVGVEQQIGTSHLLDVTWFHNDIENLIGFDFSNFPAPGTTVNVMDATTEGLEVAFRGTFEETINYSLAYTYLIADDETAGVRLLRRPSHTFGFDVNAKVCERLLLGVGGYLIDDRMDFGVRPHGDPIQGENYFTTRVYGAYTLCENVELNFRIENASDEKYEEIDGFPGLPFGAYVGLRISF